MSKENINNEDIIEAHVISAVYDGEEPGSITLNGVNIGDKLEKCVTYEVVGDYKRISLENISFTKDVTLFNARLVMANNDIVLNNNCCNIIGLDSYINIKDINASNNVTINGDAIIAHGSTQFSLWNHLTDDIIHVSQDDRDRWNSKVDRTIFVLAEADENDYPAVENPNTTYIYLVKDKNETKDFYYNKWAWVEREDIEGGYSWEKIGSPILNLSQSTNEDITDNSAIENNTIIHDFKLNSVDVIKSNESKVPKSSAVVNYVTNELNNYVAKSGSTMSGDLEMSNNSKIVLNNSDFNTTIYNYGIETPVIYTTMLMPKSDNTLYVTNTEDEETQGSVTLYVSGDTNNASTSVSITSIPNDHSEIVIGDNIKIDTNSGVDIGDQYSNYTLTLNGSNIGDAIAANTTNIANLSNKVDTLEATHFIVVDVLPDPEDAITHAIYLVPKAENDEPKNIKDEYICVSDNNVKYWEKIGDTQIKLDDYAKITYVDEQISIVNGQISDHVTNNDRHLTEGEREKWNNKQDAISVEGNEGDDIKTSLDLEDNKITSSASLNKISDITNNTSSTLVPETQAVVNYITKVTPDVSNFVEKTGDTMTGQLTFSKDMTDAAITLPFGNYYDEGGHIILGGADDTKIECADISSSAIMMNTQNTDTEEFRMNASMFTSNSIISAVTNMYGNPIIMSSMNPERVESQKLNENGEPISASIITNEGNITATESVTTSTLLTNAIKPVGGNNDITLHGNLMAPRIAGKDTIGTIHAGLDLKAGRNLGIGGNAQINGSTLLIGNVDFYGESNFYNNVKFSRTSIIDGPAITIEPVETKADITIRGKNKQDQYESLSVWDHMVDAERHVTKNQLDVLAAAESGCFIYKPTEPDPERPDEPYKNVNPKLLMKNDDDSGYREATLQAAADTGSSIKIVKNNDNYSACISTGNRPDGSKIELTDNTVTIGTAYRSGEGNLITTNINGNLNVGDSTTNYNLTLNGTNIGTAITNTAIHINDEKVHLSSDEKIAVDTIIEDISKKSNANLTSAGNGEGSIAIIKPISNNSDIYLKSFTFKTRTDEKYKPEGKRMALFCSNASEAPSLFKADSTSQNTKYKLPTGWKYIGVSNNSFATMPSNTEFKYEFDNIKIEKGMMIAVMFTDFTDLNEDEFAWSRFGASAIWSETGDTKSKFYKTDLNAAVSGGKYFTVYYKTEFVEYTGESIKEATSPITLCNGCVYNVNAANISIVQPDISNKLIKSTILFTPTADIETENVFSTQIDKIICYENTLLQNKLSIIEITQVNIAGTNYITALITPNIK